MKHHEAKIEYQRALIYCRVSSERQVNEGHGLDSQAQRCIQYAQSKGLEIAAVFRDEGISGGLFDRPAMKDLVEYLDEHTTENFVIIFDDLKRFARDVAVHLQLRKELIARGAKLECPNFKFEDSPEGRFVETIIAATAQLDREQNKRQDIQKQRARLESGYWPFHPPAGLKFIKEPGKGKLLVVNEPYATIYKQAFEQFRDYKLNTLEEVMNFILQEYQKHDIHRPLSLHGVTRLLKCPLYAGYIEYPHWDIPFAKAQHEGFISLETFQAVQAKLNKSSKPRLRKDYNEDFPLRNYVLCQECKKPMTAAWFKGRRERYPKYKCKTKLCPFRGKTIAREDVEGSFEQLLEQTIPHKDVLALAEQILLDMWKDRAKRDNEVKVGIQKQIKNLEDKNVSYLLRVSQTKDVQLVDEYEKLVSNNLEKVKELKRELEQNKYSQDGFQTALRVVFEYLENPIVQWKKPEYQSKRLLLNMYFDQKIVYNLNSGFQTAEIPYICRVIRHKQVSKNSLVEMAGVKPASKTHSPDDSSQD
jgi:site-specific DNA recombinase